MTKGKDVPEQVNRLRNANFARGRDVPAHWKWNSEGGGANWDRVAPDGEGPPRLRISTVGAKGSASFSQEVGCVPGKHYRIEAVISCRLRPGSDDGGAVLRVLQQPSKGRLDPASPGASLATPPVTGTGNPVTLRAYYQAPAVEKGLKRGLADGAKKARVLVGIEQATGWLVVHEVRFIRILEPEHSSHPFAALPPAHAMPPPRRVGRVCVCSASAEQRPITDRLRTFFGQANVTTLGPEDLNAEVRNGSVDSRGAMLGRQPLPNGRGSENGRGSDKGRSSEGARGSFAADAILLPDVTPPRGLRGTAALRKLAENRIVIISLPAYAALTRKSASPAVVRRIEQVDDPIHARVTYGNFATGGFALHDAFVFAWAGKKPGSYCQNQFRKSKPFQAHCKREGLITLLDSLCERDATSEQPVALFRPSANGALFVMDIEPVEAEGSTMGEPILAMRLLLSILGQELDSFGQYLTPIRTEAAFREMIREFTVRFPNARVHDADVPSSEVTEQIVTVGGEDESFGLPLMPKPVILLRSGLLGGDIESMFGCLTWLKQFVRPEPHACPYGLALASRYRIAWVPSVAPWQGGTGNYGPLSTGLAGGRRSGEPPQISTSIEAEPGALALLIDVVSHPMHRTRVTLAREGGGDVHRATLSYDHVAKWLPLLFLPNESGSKRATPGFWRGSELLFTAEPGGSLWDRSTYAWRVEAPPLEISVDAGAFAEGAHADALRAGAQVVRIEVPGNDADFPAFSIYRTGVLATLIEMVIGLQFGLIAVNRSRSAIHFDGFPPVSPGAALIADRNEPILRQAVCQAS